MVPTTLFSIFLLYLNYLYPYYPGDDLVFQLIIPEDGIMGSERVNSLGDLVESQYNFYFNYHYRILNHFILQGLLALPPIIFDLLNVFAFLLLPSCILKFSDLKADPQYGMKYLFLLFFIWVFHINLGWAYFPATGALNYTWYLIPQLWYLALILRYADGQSPPKGWILGLAAINALGNENACIMLCLLTAVVIFLTRKKKQNFLYFAFLFFVVGGIFMLASPSIAKRLETQGHMSAGLGPHTLEYLKRTAYYCLRYLPLLLIMLVPAKRIIVNNNKRLLLLLAFAAATLAMISAPLFEARSAVLGFFVLLSLAIVQVDTKWKTWPVYGITLVALLLCATRLPAFQQQYDRHQINEQILEANRGATHKVSLERYCDYSTRDYLLCHENSEDPQSFDNRTLAAYYNLTEVALAEKYVQSNRRAALFTSLQESPAALASFQQQVASDKVQIYTKQSGDGLDILIETKDNSAPYYILRGATRGWNKHKLLQVLPQAVRLYFLDFLESITLKKQEMLTKEEKRYNYFFVADYQRYNYFLLSRYSFDIHAPIGEIYRVDSK